ncbi:M99 family carboxypeptidase catalytic domain-containing protein [Sulfuricurvum sp.]|uniref:M99 family carboxypeptidase catalytic domain-containing protein n=1 Tax=Sulfuricurvum sp. TaxID=2025608 RepID=UPI002E371A86|nr:M99 family carboxypeptidase catalytic domain-containing protein [Sulfuricurvum sp.]HEX5330570.1 M99 family carboxypeptidase catalytic domain-containing protein [Sulfuricurvum sp.]
MYFSVLLSFLFLTSLYALPFNFIKKETDTLNSPTLLVIGGIHGNEPGGYFSSAILSRYYTITEGNLWIVPDLNRPSIQQNNRGINGDMNRKFADIDPQDPDIEAVREIQKIITEQQVGLVLNLHDGHGFYRKEHLNTIFNPNAWGQTCVIDQRALDGDHPYGNLNEIASKVNQELNNALIADHHFFDVRNTNTRFDDEAMKHSLTFFAVSHNKPAFAIETSKNLPTLHHKVFYQLNAIECYMKLMGIKYERTFDLNLDTVKVLLDNYESVTINNNFYLNLNNLKNSLSFIPLQSDRNEFTFTHPLGSIRKNNEQFDIFIGNQKISSLIPSYNINDLCSDPITIIVDGEVKNITFATDFFVTADFKVINEDVNTRLNIIGFTRKGVKDESNIRVKLSDLDSKYSVDTSNKSYRLEFYRKNRFCGMILVHFK